MRICCCEESPFGQILCVIGYLCVGVIILGFIVMPIGFGIVCIIRGLIKKYTQADAIYMDSLTKKDYIVIGIND
jgi:hypothetical protein